MLLLDKAACGAVGKRRAAAGTVRFARCRFRPLLPLLKQCWLPEAIWAVTPVFALAKPAQETDLGPSPATASITSYSLPAPGLAPLMLVPSVLSVARLAMVPA